MGGAWPPVRRLLLKSLVLGGSYLDGIPVSFAEVAFLAQRLKIVENRLAILGDWEDVVYVKCHSMLFTSPTTPFAGPVVSDQDISTKPSGNRRPPLPPLRFPTSTEYRLVEPGAARIL